MDAAEHEIDGHELRARADLEWASLLERIALHTTSALGKAAVLGRRPSPSLEAARELTRLTHDALVRFETGAAIPARDFPDLSSVIERLRRFAVASADELRQVANVLGLAHELRRYAAACREREPALALALGSDAKLDELRQTLDHAIDEGGTLNDRASPELRRARREAEFSRQELLRRLNQLMNRYGEVLRERYYAEREGRYVLPVRSDAHLRVEGIVLGSSASGGTLYVEPKEITELGNRLRVAEAEVEREEFRVLGELSRAAGLDADAIGGALTACIRADELAAIARWGATARALAVFPDDELVLDLRAMRHPLLVENDAGVVANDIELQGRSALVISGPNAGGKTVALKCLGLAAWMVRSGLPLPVAKGTRVGFFAHVLTDVGDDQSLARSLSTFSGHIKNLSDIIERARPGALVLLDEVAAGTDPEEGAALATAVLEELVERGAAVAVTTHYERLKELATEDTRFVNASVGFDMKAMAPTFKLHLGSPGPSSALAVAMRFGLSEKIVERARALIPAQSVERENVVLRLQESERALAEARRLAVLEAERQVELRVELEHEQRQLRQREQDRLSAEARELTAAVRQARAQLRDAATLLKTRELPANELRSAEKQVNEAAKLVAIGSPLMQARAELSGDMTAAAPAASSLLPGTVVRLVKLGTTAEVLEAPARGQVRVLAGNLKLTVPMAELRLGNADARSQHAQQRKTARKREKVAANAMLAAVSPVRTPDNTADVRGQRVDEALTAIDAFLDRMLGEGESAGFVLHGHGTGALKSAVREHLSASPYVTSARPAEPDSGGDAFTVFWLKS